MPADAAEDVRDRGKRANVSERGHFVDDAEAQTGITKQQVSRWRKRLQDKGKYRAQANGKATFGSLTLFTAGSLTKPLRPRSQALRQRSDMPERRFVVLVFASSAFWPPKSGSPTESHRAEIGHCNHDVCDGGHWVIGGLSTYDDNHRVNNNEQFQPNIRR